MQDKSGTIEKSELRKLFGDLFPAFPKCVKLIFASTFVTHTCLYLQLTPGPLRQRRVQGGRHGLQQQYALCQVMRNRVTFLSAIEFGEFLQLYQRLLVHGKSVVCEMFILTPPLHRHVQGAQPIKHLIEDRFHAGKVWYDNNDECLFTDCAQTGLLPEVSGAASNLMHELR